MAKGKIIRSRIIKAGGKTLNIKGASTKYGNKWCEIDGIKFQSQKEGGYYLYLKSEQKKGRVKSFKLQAPFRCEVNGRLVCKYIADFVVTYADGSKKVIDVKGFRTSLYILKKKLMFACNGITIHER